MDVDPKVAPKSVFKGVTYYFCSEDDKKTFDAAPDKFITAVTPPFGNIRLLQLKPKRGRRTTHRHSNRAHAGSCSCQGQASRFSIWWGPLQVFARASEMHSRTNPGSPPIYSVEVVSISSSRSLIANCGLRINANRTFRQVRGKIDTLLVAGGDAIEQNKIDPEAVRWLKGTLARIRRVGSVCTGAMLLARAGLLDGRRATTHWNWCQTLIKRAPRARRRCRSNICP